MPAAPPRPSLPAVRVRDQVDEGEDDDPDDVDEVPVEPGDLDVEGLLRGSPPRKETKRSDSSQTTPMVTCAPWKPVRTKKDEPKMLLESPSPSWVNSVNSKN